MTDGATVWPWLFADDGMAAPDRVPDLATARRAAGRLARLTAPAFAADRVAGLARRLATPLLDESAVRHSRMLCSLARAEQARWLGRIAGDGLSVVVLKGFANAHTLYRESPEARCFGDIDLLVRPAERDRLIGLLAEAGFTFRPPPAKPWGFLSTASYVPLADAASLAEVDVHVAPDCFPAYRGLDTAAVFDGARPCVVDGPEGPVSFLAPDDGHAFLLAATNAAKDKFGPYATIKLLDGWRLRRRLTRAQASDVVARARRGGFSRPLKVFNSLLDRLAGTVGEDHDRLPRARLMAPAAACFNAVAADHAGFATTMPAAAGRLAREALLGCEPAALVRISLARLAGLVRRPDGRPPPARQAARPSPPSAQGAVHEPTQREAGS
ncbi:MAG: nucleotidyltransferase family protein [Alphaproteobacteria bacterium]